MEVGIKGAGYAIPAFRHLVNTNLGTLEQCIAHPTQDTATLGYIAGMRAIQNSGADKENIAKIIVGTESPPYKTKSAKIISEMIGLPKAVEAYDIRSACDAGGSAFIDACRLAQHRDFEGKYILVIASDVAPISKKSVFYPIFGNAAGAFVIGDEPIVSIETSGKSSFSSDMNDFYVMHDEPAYPICHGKESIWAYRFHVYNSVKNFLDEKDFKYDYVVGHTPFPKIWEWIGDEREKDAHPELFQINPFKNKTQSERKEMFKHNSIISNIGNPFNAACFITAGNFGENAKPGDKALFNTFGSGAGSNTAGMEVTERIREYQKRLEETKSTLADMVNNRTIISDGKFHSWANERTQKKYDYGNPYDILKSQDFSCVNKFESLEGVLIEKNGKNSKVQLDNGEQITAEVVGCSTLEPGTELQAGFKAKHTSDGKEKLIHYRQFFRPKGS